jgi:hypothetical protein
MAPTFVWLFTSSRTTTRRLSRRTSPALGKGLRSNDASTPRCTAKPVIERMRSPLAAYTGTPSGARRRKRSSRCSSSSSERMR